MRAAQLVVVQKSWGGMTMTWRSPLERVRSACPPTHNTYSEGAKTSAEASNKN